jgi:hypothetical protein
MARLVKNPINRESWPNFFIVGAMKAGTTSLYNYLKPVQGIYMSPNKEPHYFAAEDIPNSASRIVIRDKNKYLSLFANVKDEIAIGEASTNYLYSRNCPHRIHEVIPEAKIIIILRDPIQRAFSHYLFNVRNKHLGIHKISFIEAIKKDYGAKEKGIGTSILYVEKGLYYEQVKRYFDLFGRKLVKVLIFEEFTKNRYEKVKEVLEFLDIDADPQKNIDETFHEFFLPRNPISHSIVASTKAAKLATLLPESTLKMNLRRYLLGSSLDKPEISEEAKMFLADIFKDDVKHLESLLGRSLPWQL